MRILVAGGSGFIGSHLCDRLIQEGHNVMVLDNLATSKRENLKNVKGLKFIKADITKKISITEKIDIIANLASPASQVDFKKMQLEIAMVNTVGTKNLLDLAVSKKSGFLTASTSEIYGDPQVHPQPEDYWGNVNTIGPRSCYDESKRFAETLCYIYAEKYGLKINIARIFNTYGPRMRIDDGRAVPNFIRHALKNQPIPINGSGKQTRSFCYVSDLVDGLYKLMNYENPINNLSVFNLGNPDERKLIDLAKMIIKLTQSSSKIEHKPPLADEPQQRRPNIEKAKRELGWEPKVRLEDGLRKTIDWYRFQG